MFQNSGFGFAEVEFFNMLRNRTATMIQWDSWATRTETENNCQERELPVNVYLLDAYPPELLSKAEMSNASSIFT